MRDYDKSNTSGASGRRQIKTAGKTPVFCPAPAPGSGHVFCKYIQAVGTDRIGPLSRHKLPGAQQGPRLAVNMLSLAKAETPLYQLAGQQSFLIA